MNAQTHRTCGANVYPKGDRWSAFHGRPCGKPAKVERDGKPYCGIHDPERPALKAIQMRARQAFEERVRDARLERAAPALLAEVVKLREAVTACGIRLSFLMDEHADEYSKDNTYWVQMALKAEESAIHVEAKARGEDT